MSTYLLTWNPDEYDDKGSISAKAALVGRGKRVKSGWSTGATKSIKKGDRLFFLRLGREPRGIFGSMTATSDGYPVRHWRPSVRRKANHVDFEFDTLLDLETSAPLPIKHLEKEIPPVKTWHPMASGTQIKNPKDVQKLERLWARHLRDLGLRRGKLTPQEVEEASAVMIGHSGAGFCADPKKNAAIERAAIRFVTKHFADQGWRVKSCEEENCGFDLECSRSGKTLHVEVKGVSGEGLSFVITQNEVRQAEKDSRFRLCVVTKALGQPVYSEWSGRKFLKEFALAPISYMARHR